MNSQLVASIVCTPRELAKPSVVTTASGCGGTPQTGDSKCAPYFGQDDKLNLAILVPDALRKTTVEAAEELMIGQFTFKGVTYQFQRGIDWFFHPNGSHVGWRWDLNRHFFLLTTAKAFLYTGDGRFLSRVGEILADWSEKNPCQPGQPNWDSPFEVAARLCNWMWLYHLLSNHEFRNERYITQNLLRGIIMHANYLYYVIEIQLPNNHLLLEAKALYSASLMFKGLPFGAKLHKKAFRHLKNQVGRQIRKDGGHSEQSIGYHRIICSELWDLLFQCQKHDDMGGVELLRDPLLGMTEFLLAMLRPDGTLPSIGDTSATDTYYRFNPFMMAAVLFNNAEFKSAAVLLGEDDLTLFALGVAGAEIYNGFALEPLERLSRSFPQSGFYVINDDERVHVVIDCGPFCDTKAPFHGHDDILGFDMSIGGVPLFVDSGSDGVPTGNPEAMRWRSYFKGSAAHNVIMLDGKDRSRFDERSWVLQVAKPGDPHWFAGEKVIYFAGSHDGYSRTLKAIHRREIVLVKGQFLCIVDRVYGVGSHQIDLLYHLAPDKSAIRKGGGLIDIENEYGYLAHLTISARSGNMKVVRGRDETPLQGWVGVGSGQCVAADTIHFSTCQNLPFVAISLLQSNTPAVFKVNRAPIVPMSVDDSNACFTISNGVENYEVISATEPLSVRPGGKEIHCRFGIFKRDLADGLEILFAR